MSMTLKKWLGVPGGWDDVFLLALKTAMVAFVALLLKEYMETNEWDAPACAVDGAVVAVGTFALNAVLKIIP